MCVSWSYQYVCLLVYWQLCVLLAALVLTARVTRLLPNQPPALLVPRTLSGVVGYFDVEFTKLHGASGSGAPRSENVLSSQPAFQPLGCGLPDVYSMPGLGFPWTASEGLGGEGRPNLLDDDEHVGWIPPNIFEGEMDALPWELGHAAGTFFAGLDAGHAAAPLSAAQQPADATLFANSCSSHGTPETAASGVNPVQNGTYCSSGESVPWLGSSEADDPQQQRQLLELSRRTDTRSRVPPGTPSHVQSGQEESQHLSSAGQAAARRQLAFASPQSYPGPGASPSSHDGALSLSSLPSANSRHQLPHPEHLQVTTGARQLGSPSSTLLQQRPGAWPLADSSQLQPPQRQRHATAGGESGGDPLVFATAVSVPMQLMAEQQRQQQQQQQQQQLDAAHGYESMSTLRRASSLQVLQQSQQQRPHPIAGCALAHAAAASPAEAGRLGARCVSPVPSSAAAGAHMSPFAAAAAGMAAPMAAPAASPDGQPITATAAAAAAAPSAGFAHPATLLRTGWPQQQAPALQQQQQQQQQHALMPSDGQRAAASAMPTMAVGVESRDPTAASAAAPAGAAAAASAGQPQEQQATSQGAPSATTETAARTTSHAVPSSYPYPYPYPYPHPYPSDYAAHPGAYPPRRMAPPGLAARHSDPGWAGPWGYPWPPPPYHRAPYPYPYPPPPGYPLRAIRTRRWPGGVPPGAAMASEHYPYPLHAANPHPQQQQQQPSSLSAGAAGSVQPSAADTTEAVSPTTLWGGVRLNPEAAAAARAASAGGAPVHVAGLAQGSALAHGQGQLLHPRHSTSSSQLQADPASAESRPAVSADASGLSAQSPLAAAAAMRTRALAARRSGGGAAGPYGPAVPQELSLSAATATSPTGAWPSASAAAWHPGYAGSGPGSLGTPPRRAGAATLSSKLPAYATPPRMLYGPAVRRVVPQLPPHPGAMPPAAAVASSAPAAEAAPAAVAPAGGSATQPKALQRWPSTGLHTGFGASYPYAAQPQLDMPPAPFLPPPSPAAAALADGDTPVAKRLRTGLGGAGMEAMGAPAQLPSPRAGYPGYPRGAASGGFAAPPPQQLQHHYQHQQPHQQQLPCGPLTMMQEQQQLVQQQQQPLQL